MSKIKRYWNALTEIEKAVFGGMLGFGFLLILIGLAANIDMVIGLGGIMMIVAFAVINTKYSNKRLAAIKAAKDAQQQAKIDEYNSPQYTYPSAQAYANHTVIDFSPSDYNAQVWMFSLEQGQEIFVTRDSIKGIYYLSDGVKVPPRLVNILDNKRICRLYVHSITEKDDKRSIQIFVAYNEG